MLDMTTGMVWITMLHVNVGGLLKLDVVYLTFWGVCLTIAHRNAHADCTMYFCLPYPCIRFLQLISLVPTDPRVLQRVGEMYDSDDDRSQAFQYHYESFRYSPTNIDVISWLGAYYMESRFTDKATYYFERAALIQPSQINWQLMVASCHRKSG